MKVARFLAVLVLVASLAGCKTKKAVVSENSAAVRIDTTKNIFDSITSKLTETNTSSTASAITHAATDTTKTVAQIGASTVIDFADSGGTVNIDTTGGITLTGVKSIKGDIRTVKNEIKGFAQTDVGTLAEEKEIAKNEVKTNSHNEQANGIITNEQKQSQQETETKVTRPKWYQTIFAKIGALCFIAALLYILFLYLKRKF